MRRPKMHEIIRYISHRFGFYVRRVRVSDSKLLFAFDGKESARRYRRSQNEKEMRMQMQTNHSRHGFN